jgi:hypothetical protein
MWASSYLPNMRPRCYINDNSAPHASTSCRQPAPKAPKAEGLFEIINPSNSVNLEIAILSRKMDQLMAVVAASSHRTTMHDPCSVCLSSMHQDTDYPSAGNFSDEQINAAFSQLGNDP